MAAGASSSTPRIFRDTPTHKGSRTGRPEEYLMTRALMPNMLTPQDLEPNWEWRDRLPAWGHTSVDFERRIDHDRLRRYR